MKKHKPLIAVIMFGLTWAGIVRAEDQPIEQQTKPTILLVHGAWADSSSWNGVVDLLLKDGYTVRALPNTLRGLSADAAVISTYLKSVAGPVVLAGHSYGGSVISVASANAPNVKALVFVDAFAPDAGESVQSELASTPPPPSDFTIAVPFTASNGNEADLYVNSKYFGTVFASAEPADVTARLAATQRPFAARCLTDRAPEAVGWKTIPSWYVIGDADRSFRPTSSSSLRPVPSRGSTTSARELAMAEPPLVDLRGADDAQSDDKASDGAKARSLRDNSIIIGIHVAVVPLWQAAVDFWGISSFILPSPLAMLGTLAKPD
jgi:pimeloyl-ACP methyl ester carboxylesterase